MLVAAIHPIPITGTDGVTLKAIGDGLRYLKSHAVLKGSFIADLIAMIFGMPVALFPALVDQRFDGNARVLGLLYAAPFAGSLIASATSGWARKVPRQRSRALPGHRRLGHRHHRVRSGERPRDLAAAPRGRRRRRHGERRVPTIDPADGDAAGDARSDGGRRDGGLDHRSRRSATSRPARSRPSRLSTPRSSSAGSRASPASGSSPPRCPR